jgi:signal transduction histidine kinase
MIYVRDTGLGMSPDKVRKIMEGTAFTELGTQQEKGFGMGLVFVLEALMHTKGKLNIISEPGHGSTFTISYSMQDMI